MDGHLSRAALAGAAALTLLSTGSAMSAQEHRPWEVKETPYGITALGHMEHDSYDIQNIGLFCGTGIYRGKVMLYLYGANFWSDQTRSIHLYVNDTRVDLQIKPGADMGYTPLSTDLARQLSAAKELQIKVVNGTRLMPETVHMAGAASAIPQALRKCLK